MDFTTFIDAKSLAISLSQLVNAIVSNTANPSISSKDLQDKVSHEQKSTHLDVWHICAGHDLMNILSIGLQKAIGNRKPNEVARDVLERHFRLAYEYEFFQTSQLWKSLRIWEAKHPAYKLFRD
jgi:hypothetical protein